MFGGKATTDEGVYGSGVISIEQNASPEGCWDGRQSCDVSSKSHQSAAVQRRLWLCPRLSGGLVMTKGHPWLPSETQLSGPGWNTPVGCILGHYIVTWEKRFIRKGLVSLYQEPSFSLSPNTTLPKWKQQCLHHEPSCEASVKYVGLHETIDGGLQVLPGPTGWTILLETNVRSSHKGSLLRSHL